MAKEINREKSLYSFGRVTVYDLFVSFSNLRYFL